MNQDNFSVRIENRFIMVNYDVIMSGLLTAYEIAVYVTLCAHASNMDRSCFPSYSTLARRAGGRTGLPVQQIVFAARRIKNYPKNRTPKCNSRPRQVADTMSI